MKIAVSLFVGLALSVFTGFAQDANAIVKKVRDKLNTVKDYEAEGKLVTNVSFMKVPDSKVTVYYKNPDKFKIRKQDGISIVPKGGTSVNLNSLFAGGGEFTAVAAGKTTFRGKELTVVKMLPLAENSDVVVSTLYVDETASLIHKAITTTKESGTYEIEMTYGKYATWGLPDQVTFIFNTKNYKLPKGLAFDYDTGEKPAAANKSGDQQGRVQISYTSYKINKGIATSVFGS